MTAYTFNQLFDFTRTTSATYVGSNGLIQTTPASRNLLTFTQEFDNASWGKTGVTVTANATTAPDGTSTADTQVENTSTGTHEISGTNTITAGQIYALTFFLKANGRSLVRVMQTWNGTADRVHADFDLANGTVGAAVVTGTAVSASAPVITSFGNGWYRCQISGSCPSGTALLSYARMMSAAGVVSYTGDGTSGVFIWGAQLELGGTATTYTRNNGGVYPARFDYDPVTLAPKGILIEEQRTNLLTYSEQFDNVIWGGARRSITANATTSPDGTVDADKFVEDTSTNTHTLVRNITVTATTTYTYSIYLKAAGRDFAQVRYENGASTQVFSANVNLTTGAFTTSSSGSPTGTAANVTTAGEGWWRVAITVTASDTSFIAVVFTQAVSGTNSYTGDGTSGIFLYGAQFEAGAFATSYIPTVASQVTRSADLCSITAPMFAPWYNQSEGTFVVDADSGSAIGNQILVQADDGTQSDRTLSRFNGNVPAFIVQDNAVNQVNLTSGTIAAGVPQKLAYAYKVNDFAFVFAGASAVTDAAGTLPTVDRLRLGINAVGIEQLNGHIRSIRYFPFRASNNQLQALTL